MKRGISLIAVLMFMLAATTASVVIFKWIGSENFSSGARLKASEAYQASESGIDYVRSWMENKAADVGALVTQYASTNPKPNSLKIFSDISVGDKNQKFSAYLIGIDITSKPILKLKILVEGSARDNSKMSQTAIFSTDGLYKIFIPAEIEKQKSTTDLNAYFGSDMKFDGNKRFSSATINGNWTGNPPKIDKDFIVTGNLYNSGNSIDVGNNACVGGNYSPNNNNVKIGGGLYIGESVISSENVNGQSKNTSGFIGNADSYQDVYCEGNMQFGNTGVGEMISGNLTVNGKISNFNGGRRYRVDGSLVLGDTEPTATMTTAFIEGTGLDQGNSFVVCGDVWTTNPAGVQASQTQGAGIKFNYSKTPAEGCPSKSDAALFFTGANRTTGEEYKTQPASPIGYFRSKATSNPLPSASNKPAGASSIKKYCMDIFGNKTTGCRGSQYKVDDPIATSLNSIKTFLTTNAPKSTETSGIFKCLNNTATNIRCQGDINTCGSNIKITNVLNNCYEKLKNKSDRLYGGTGGYLIVKLNQTESYYYDQNQQALNGKFIFIYEEPQEFVTIAPTTSTSKVMIFFEQGVSREMRSSGCVSDGGGGYYKYNYFIYSLGDIAKTNNWGDKCPLEGNIFFPSSGCKRLQEADNNFSLEKNEELVDELMDMGIICKRSKGYSGDCTTTELNKSSSSSSDDDEIINPAIIDNNWIPIAARLPIKLESKEISKEKAQTPEEFKKSILIMPRVIYLAPNQISKQSDLSKYYAPLYLNGANTTPAISANSITCGITDFSAKKRYTCTFQGRTDISNFYVIIDPNKDVASSPAVTALCKWDGRGKTMFTGQSKPSDPTIECSSGDPNVSSWSGLPRNPLEKGTTGIFTPIPGDVTCDGEVPTNHIKIDCGTLTVKTTPTISCVGTDQTTTLPIKPTIPVINLNDPDNICSGGLTDKIWKVNRGSSTTLSNSNWDNLFSASTTIYNNYRVSGICGDYGTLDANCTGSATVSGTTTQANDCEYRADWCGGQEFSNVILGTSNKPVLGDCVFISDFTKINTASERSGGGTVLINGISCSGNATECARISNIKTPKDGGYYVYVQTGGISAGATGNDGWVVTPAPAKSGCTAVNSSGTSTITCTFPKNSYTINESIDANISCTNNGSLNNNSMSFSFDGISPASPDNWKSGLSTKYTTSGTSTVKITGAKCNGTTVAETACTPSLNITIACTQLTLNADGIYQTLQTSTTTSAGSCYSFPCTGSLEAGYVGGSNKKITVPICGSEEYTIIATGSGEFKKPPASIPYTHICNPTGNVQVFLKDNLSSQTQYMNFKCNSTPATGPTVTCDLRGGTYNIGALIDRPTVSCGTGFNVGSMTFGGNDLPDQTNGWNSGGGGTGTYKTSGSKSDITLSSVTCSAISSTATHTITNTSCTNPFSINAVTCNVAGTNNNKTTFNINENITSPALTNCDNPSNRNYTYQGSSMTNTSNWNTAGGQAQFTSAGTKSVTLSSVQCNGVTVNNISCSVTINAASSSSVASSSSRASSSSVASSSGSSGGETCGTTFTFTKPGDKSNLCGSSMTITNNHSSLNNCTVVCKSTIATNCSSEHINIGSNNVNVSKGSPKTLTCNIPNTSPLECEVSTSCW